MKEPCPRGVDFPMIGFGFWREMLKFVTLFNINHYIYNIYENQNLYTIAMPEPFLCGLW